MNLAWIELGHRMAKALVSNKNKGDTNVRAIKDLKPNTRVLDDEKLERKRKVR